MGRLSATRVEEGTVAEEAIQCRAGVEGRAELGVPDAELVSETGIVKQTYHGWKAKCADLEMHQVGQVAQPQEEKRRLNSLLPSGR